jgi:hypothetical protein
MSASTTKIQNRHAWNALKYLTAFPVVFAGYFVKMVPLLYHHSHKWDEQGLKSIMEHAVNQW